jgi:REP element-mobilizing transposase RayT
VPHLVREDFAARHPVHVTLRLQPDVGYLRAPQRAKIVREALAGARGLRVIHYSIQGSHLHLIVEAADAHALSRGMQGLATSLARRLNAAASRSGPVFVDRYHARALTTPTEVASAIRYVVGNYRRHARESLNRDWTDPYATSIDRPLSEPETWLLRVGWRKGAPARR